MAWSRLLKSWARPPVRIRTLSWCRTRRASASNQALWRSTSWATTLLAQCQRAASSWSKRMGFMT